VAVTPAEVMELFHAYPAGAVVPCSKDSPYTSCEYQPRGSCV
jgi:hypothetical protein